MQEQVLAHGELGMLEELAMQNLSMKPGPSGDRPLGELQLCNFGFIINTDRNSDYSYMTVL